MNDINKPFFKDPAEPKEDDLLTWLLIFYCAWEREFHAALGNIDFLISDENVKNKLIEKKSIAEKARDQIRDTITKTGYVRYAGEGEPKIEFHDFEENKK